MAQQIRFFQKNIIDLSQDSVTMTVTDLVADNSGQEIIDFVRNRNNSSAWLTTESTDAANTQILAQFGVGRDVSSILLVKHNWKAFTIQYWNELTSTWTSFSTPIAETVNTDETTHFQFDTVETNQIRIIITGTQVADEDKELYQLIVTADIGAGQLAGWPVIKNPTHDTNKRKTKMLSGKVHVVESVGSFMCSLEVSNWKSVADVSLIEDIFFRREGVLLWLCGGDESQFAVPSRGYRLEDLYYVRPTNSFEPELVKGIYSSGQKIRMDLQEAIE